MSQPIITHSAAATEQLGEALGRRLRPGDIVVLTGELGAGKTTLVRGLARGLGADPAQVRSPSFTLANVYNGRFPLYHLDLYRVQGEAALASLGWEEYFGGTPTYPPHGPGVTAVEWGERAEALLNAAGATEALVVTLAHHPDEPDRRTISGAARGGDEAKVAELQRIWDTATNETRIG